MSEIMLPTEDFVPEQGGVPQDFGMILFGPPKVGKTTFGASWPKSLLLECEPGGAKYVKCRKVDINNLTEFRQYWNLLKEDKTYETIVVDSLDRVAGWIEEEVCKELGLSSIMDAKKGERHGAQWGEYANRVLGFIAGIQLLGKRTIFLAHTKKAETDNVGFVITPKTINLYGQTAGRVIALVENIGHMYAKEEADGTVKRWLSFRPGTYVEAGSRHPALTDRIIEIPRENPYAALEALFVTPQNGHKPEAEKETKKLAKAGR